MASKLGRYLAPFALAGALAGVVICQACNAVGRNYTDKSSAIKVIDCVYQAGDITYNVTITEGPFPTSISLKSTDGSAYASGCDFNHDNVFDIISAHGSLAHREWLTNDVKGSHYEQMKRLGVPVASEQDTRDIESLVKNASDYCSKSNNHGDASSE